MKLSVGIVGAGFIAQTRHLPVYKEESSTKIQAIYDADFNKANKIAKIYKIPAVYKSVEDMFDKESLDIVDICSPASTHAKYAIEALKKGSNVIVEKPMAMDFQSAKEVCKKVKKEQKFTVIQNYRFTKEYRLLKKMMKEKKFGGTYLLHCDYESPKVDFNDQFDPNFKHGIIFETGIHDIDIARDILGEVIRVKSIILKRYYSQSQSLLSFLEHKNGSVSILNLSFNGATLIHKIKVHGIKIRATIDYEVPILKIERNLNAFSLKENLNFIKGEILEGFRRVYGHYKRLIFPELTLFGGLEPFRDIIHKFIVCIIKDEEPPVTVEEAYENMKIIEACRKSLETGEVQKIEDID